jgi:hypothetical protein
MKRYEEHLSTKTVFLSNTLFPLAVLFCIVNPLTATHENIRAGFKCPQCYARVNTMR